MKGQIRIWPTIAPSLAEIFLRIGADGLAASGKRTEFAHQERTLGLEVAAQPVHVVEECNKPWPITYCGRFGLSADCGAKGCNTLFEARQVDCSAIGQHASGGVDRRCNTIELKS